MANYQLTVERRNKKKVNHMPAGFAALAGFRRLFTVPGNRL